MTRPWSRLILVGVVALFAASAARLDAAGAKVPEADQIKAKLRRLFNGEVDFSDQAAKEKVLLEVENVLKKDAKNNVALKTPEFWVEAMQEGRFTGNQKRTIGKLKDVGSIDIDVPGIDEKTNQDKPLKSKLWFRAGGMLKPAQPAPLLLTVLERGADPKAFLTAESADTFAELNKNWVLAAIVVSDDFPLDKTPRVIASPFWAIRDKYNVDSNRWYLEGVGTACEGVQAGANLIAHRLAGLILRGPAKAVTSVNSALYPTLVVHAAGAADAKAVAAAYAKIDEKNNTAIEVPDAAAVGQMSEQILGWFGQHPARVMPSSYTFETTITDTDGEPWTGSLSIVSPAKRGVPTVVKVNYDKAANTVTIDCDNLSEFWLYLNDDLVNLDNKVTVKVNGHELVSKVLERNLRGMLEEADRWGEYGRSFTAIYRGVVPAKAPAAAVPPPANPPPAGPPPAGPPPAGEGGDKKDGGGAPPPK